ncbi:MAG: ankyrin repeat domain-containing protein [Povalibacter sp.]
MRVVAFAALLLLSFVDSAQAESSDQLAIAVANDDPAMAQSVLNAGVDINADLGQGRTPLITAAMMTRPLMVKFLLEHGADLNRESSDGAIGNALSAAFFAMNGVALTNDLDHPDPANHAAALEVLRLIVARKPNLNVLIRRGPTQMSPLMIASNAGVPDVVKVLLDGGASPNFANGGKYTALDYAVDRAPVWLPASASDRAEVVRLLIAAGAQTQKKAKDGLSPIERAHRAGNQAVIAALSR